MLAINFQHQHPPALREAQIGGYLRADHKTSPGLYHSPAFTGVQLYLTRQRQMKQKILTGGVVAYFDSADKLYLIDTQVMKA